MLTGTGLITGAGKVPINILFRDADCSTGSGIGQATAVAYVRAGCRKLALADISQSGLERTTQLIRPYDEKLQVLELPVDVSDQNAVEDMVKKTVETFGRLDYGKCLLAISLMLHKI